MSFSRLSVLMAAGLALTACTTSQNIDPIDISNTISPEPEQSITVTELLGIPETSIRPPADSPIVPADGHRILSEGLYAFYGTNESEIHEVNSSNNKHEITGIFTDKKRVFSWSYGSSTLFRNSKAVNDWGKISSTPIEKGAVRIRTETFPKLNFKAQFIAYDISGKIVREFIRDSNNQLEELAFYAPGHVVFPKGSRAYHVVYTLSEDEIVRPIANAFTGAQTLEKLRDKFSSLINPFCVNYINLEDAKSYGIFFDTNISQKLPFKKNRKEPTEGTYQLIDTKKESIFCQYLGTKTIYQGKWRIRTIQGTRVLELDTPADIASQNVGIQPVNENAVRVAFAEIYPDGANKKNTKTQVVPVRVIRKNEPVIDFRLKFNKVAADAMRETLRAAQRSSKH